MSWSDDEGNDVDYVDLLGIGIEAMRGARTLPGIRRELLGGDQRLEMVAHEGAGNPNFAGGDAGKLLVEAERPVGIFGALGPSGLAPGLPPLVLGLCKAHCLE